MNKEEIVEKLLSIVEADRANEAREAGMSEDMIKAYEVINKDQTRQALSDNVDVFYKAGFSLVLNTEES